MEDNAKEWSYQVLRYEIIEVDKLWPVILKFIEYIASRKEENNPDDDKELPKE